MNKGINTGNYGTLGILMEAQRKVELKEWPDSSGEDDHGRGMDSNQMKSLKPGDRVDYNDGRPGHSGVEGKVLEQRDNHVSVHFADRAQPSAIGHNDKGFTDHMKYKSGIQPGDKIATPHDNNVHTVLAVHGNNVVHSPENGGSVLNTHISKVNYLH